MSRQEVGRQVGKHTGGNTDSQILWLLSQNPRLRDTENHCQDGKALARESNQRLPK
jgi:hypothetical protein